MRGSFSWKSNGKGLKREKKNLKRGGWFSARGSVAWKYDGKRLIKKKWSSERGGLWQGFIYTETG